MSGRVVEPGDFARLTALDLQGTTRGVLGPHDPLLPEGGPHLLQISAERLATLPEGLLARASSANGWDGRTFKRAGGVVVRFDHAAEVDTVRGPAWLVLDDTVTAAVVAACIVRPWLPEPGTAWLANARWHAGGLPAWGLVERAERMLDMTPIQIETLARLARAAMEAA